MQSIDYTGEEVQVTTTEGTGFSAQKVSASVPLEWEGLVGFLLSCRSLLNCAKMDLLDLVDPSLVEIHGG